LLTAFLPKAFSYAWAIPVSERQVGVSKKLTFASVLPSGSNSTVSADPLFFFLHSSANGWGLF
jgi:hypothetical protein